MVERICPRCEQGNPGEQAFCGHCGLALDQPLARQQPAALAYRPISLPARWREPAKVMALGAATLAVEAGLAWLNRRQSAAPKPGTALAVRSEPQTARVIAVGRRVVETWSGGQLQQRTEERVMWMVPEDR